MKGVLTDSSPFLTATCNFQNPRLELHLCSTTKLTCEDLVSFHQPQATAFISQFHNHWPVFSSEATQANNHVQ